MIPIAQPCIGQEERAAVDRVLAGGGLSRGPEVERFEAEFAELVDGRHCIAVNSGTSALHLALLAAGIGPGDEVIVPSFTFAATANAVRLAGATPVFVDIDPDTFCMSPTSVESAVTSRTAALMPVHLYGHPAAMRELGGIATRHGLLVVEDAAQAHGATLADRPVGTWGKLAAFSFYPTKNMTTGEGGMVVTDDAAMARTVRLLTNQGMERQYENEIVGFNLRMTDMAAAIGRVQLRRLDDMNGRRIENAASYIERLTTVVCPSVPGDVRHVFHQFTVRSDDRDALIQRLADNKVDARVYYPVPVHRLPAFALDLDLQETDRAVREVVSIPVGPHVSSSDVDRIVEVIG